MRITRVETIPVGLPVGKFRDGMGDAACNDKPRALLIDPEGWVGLQSVPRQTSSLGMEQFGELPHDPWSLREEVVELRRKRPRCVPEAREKEERGEEALCQ
jgi:hypothetical protein